MDRKHFEPRSARRSVKTQHRRGLLPPSRAAGLIGPWLRLANLLPPLDDPPEVRAVWSIGSMTSQLLEGRALESSLPNANDFMERARAADLAELVKLRSGTEKQALLELAQQVYFVLAGLVRRQTRASLTWVRVAYEIRPQRHTLVVRTWNPFTRFTEALKEIETSR